MGPSELRKVSKQIEDPETGQLSYSIPKAQWDALLGWMADVDDALAAKNERDTALIPWEKALEQLREAGIDV